MMQGRFIVCPILRHFRHCGVARHLLRRSHDENDPECDPAMQSRVFDARGQHEAAEHHEVGGAHVVHGHLILEVKKEE